MKLYRLLTMSAVVLIWANMAFSQQAADELVSFKPGEGQSSGQSAEYFPANAFNLPISSASELAPSVAPENVVSLGMDGEIVLSFKDKKIIDGEGPDFTVFENVFKNPVNGKYFIEPGVVSVSQDGTNFIDFPFDSLTLKGCAGVTPTNGSANPFDAETSGGNSFDIGDLGMTWIKYIRIKDISRFIRDDESHPYHDFTISGFDLDAVAGLHLEQFTSYRAAKALKAINTESVFYLEMREPVTAKLYDLAGNEIDRFSGEVIRIDKNKYPSQALFLVINDGEGYRTIKIII